MTNVLLRAGFYGCAHLGYRMAGMARTHPSGLNIREVDGYATYDLVMRDMIACGVQFISDGGDLFHVHAPSPRAIDEALAVDDLRVTAGVVRTTNTGNHDKASVSNVSAVASVHRPALGSYSVFPRQERPDGEVFGPHPGLYEVHQPVPDMPLYLHIVSDYGLDDRLQDRGIHIHPTPIDNSVNILVSHGIFSADDRMFGAVDGHGSHRVIPSEWVERGFDASILSDYHTPGPIPGFGPDKRKSGQVWMTGSLIGRGFSDDICSRGWLLLELLDTGYVRITHKPVWSRPQRDFEPIDCSGKTVDDINVLVRKRLAGQRWWDDESARITGDGGWLLRQRFRGASAAQRHSLRALAGEWTTAAGDAAYWGVSFETTPAEDTPTTSVQRNISHGRTRINYAEDFANRQTSGRVGAVLAAAAPAIRERAARAASKALERL
ncbi:hypothetical protein [Gordonia alkanivorans]|uniref:hypothetical protein n=1 Tax=Gordonia alkanivorans TaxID=84096 RepID=UPI0012DBE3FC|nr:hypothetical protein [Gordonia alkanivorans]